MYHLLVELLQAVVTQVVSVCQGPLPAGMLIAPAIPLPREIYPLRMTELVAHEIQVTISGRTYGRKAYQLYQSHAPVHDRIGGLHIHGEVHLLVH